MGDARITVVAAQPPGFGEFGGAVAGIGRSEKGASMRMLREAATCLFEPDDRVVQPRLQQIYFAGSDISHPNEGIARAQANELLLECDRVLQRPCKVLALAEAGYCVRLIAVELDDRFVLGNRFDKP